MSLTGSALEESEVLALVAERGLALDEGDRIGGPFIPDGVVRIYDPDTLHVLGEGATPAEAWDNLPD